MGKRRVQSDSAFGHRLKLAMSLVDMEAGQLAKLEGVGSGTVSRWRRGELPNELRLPRLAAALRVRLEWLKSGQEPMHADPGHNGAGTRRPYEGQRPPASSYEALRVLELRLELALIETGSGASVSRRDLETWLDLVRWIRTTPDGGSATPVADALAEIVEEVESAEVESHRRKQADG